MLPSQISKNEKDVPEGYIEQPLTEEELKTAREELVGCWDSGTPKIFKSLFPKLDDTTYPKDEIFRKYDDDFNTFVKAGQKDTTFTNGETNNFNTLFDPVIAKEITQGQLAPGYLGLKMFYLVEKFPDVIRKLCKDYQKQIEDIIRFHKEGKSHRGLSPEENESLTQMGAFLEANGIPTSFIFK